MGSCLWTSYWFGFLLASCLAFGLPLITSVGICVLGLIWMGVASIIVAQSTGMTDISPLSGMALITVAGAMYTLDKNVTLSLAIAMCVCIAIGQAADMMQDLKTGFLLGGSPQETANSSILYYVDRFYLFYGSYLFIMDRWTKWC